VIENKGNNKITEHRAIFQRKAKLISQQTDKISQQPENWENRNGPDLVQAFPCDRSHSFIGKSYYHRHNSVIHRRHITQLK
jgi:hypothetical protein